MKTVIPTTRSLPDLRQVPYLL